MKIHLLLFCLMLLAVQLHAQKLSFEYLTVKEGLPQNTIGSIIKDKYGFMWFGTWNGLCRYDGYSFKVYRTIPGDTTSIANSRIHHIYKDSAGRPWPVKPAYYWWTTHHHQIPWQLYQRKRFGAIESFGKEWAVGRAISLISEGPGIKMMEFAHAPI